MDCQEIYPEINGVGLPYKMSSHVISIPSVNLIKGICQLKQQTRCQQHLDTKETVELLQYKLTCHIAKEECNVQHKYRVPAVSSYRTSLIY